MRIRLRNLYKENRDINLRNLFLFVYETGPRLLIFSNWIELKKQKRIYEYNNFSDSFRMYERCWCWRHVRDLWFIEHPTVGDILYKGEGHCVYTSIKKLYVYVSRHNQEQLPVNFTPVTEKEFITREVLNSNKLFTTQKVCAAWDSDSENWLWIF